MALLQIAEPRQSSSPHEHKLAVGIDLGTTNSLMATVRNGKAEILLNKADQPLTPSIVHFGKNKIIVGNEAKSLAEQDPTNTIISIKRLMGKSLKDLKNNTLTSNLPYHLQASENGLPLLQTAQGLQSPISISAQILTHLKTTAEQRLGEELTGAVITVPAYFDDAQRQATKDAAKMAGLQVLRLLNEPTAAAIAYGLESQEQGVIAVYDLGGGTFDISILRLTKGVFEVLATVGDTSLGGDDFDYLLGELICQKLVLGNLSPLNPYQKREILNFAQQIKIKLSSVDENGKVSAEFGGQICEITRREFDELIAPLVKRSLLACGRALKDGGVTVEEINNVVMVGGSTRVPLVRKMVREFFCRPPLTSIDPDQVVAIGAGIQADILVGNKPASDMLLLDVIPLSLGIETMGGLVEKIIPRNTTIPVAKAQEFTTFKDGQTAMNIHVVQGEREMVADCRSLARFSLKGIPPMVAGSAVIRVTYQVDADGLLSVTAMEKSTGVNAHIQVKASYGLTDTEISQMLKSAISHANEDIQARNLIEQKVEADRALDALISALAQDGNLLNTAELKQIHQAMTKVRSARNGNSDEEIKSALTELEQATQNFATLRMDHQIKLALTGQEINQLIK